MAENLAPTAAAEEERAERIVGAAYALLDEAGLEGLTIRAVLARTGLARRAFYDRFAGKDDLVLAVFSHTLRQAAEVLSAELAALPDPLARLQRIVTDIVVGRPRTGFEGAWSSGRRGAALSREHLRLAEARPAELQAAIRPIIALIAAQLAHGMAAGVVREASPERLAVLVYNLVSTTVHAELLAEEAGAKTPSRREQLAEEIWEFCRRAIAA